jgi:hypothetical protein
MINLKTRIAVCWHQSTGTRLKGKIHVKMIRYTGIWGGWYGYIMTPQGKYTFSACDHHVYLFDSKGQRITRTLPSGD